MRRRATPRAQGRAKRRAEIEWNATGIGLEFSSNQERVRQKSAVSARPAACDPLATREIPTGADIGKPGRDHQRAHHGRLIEPMLDDERPAGHQSRWRTANDDTQRVETVGASTKRRRRLESNV